MGFKVNKEQCSTCIFGANSPLAEGRLNYYKKEWEKKDTHQECHHATAQEKNIVCKGYFDAAMKGAVNMGQLMRIAGRLNVIEFVEVKED